MLITLCPQRVGNLEFFKVIIEMFERYLQCVCIYTKKL